MLTFGCRYAYTWCMDKKYTRGKNGSYAAKHGYTMMRLSRDTWLKIKELASKDRRNIAMTLAIIVDAAHAAVFGDLYPESGRSIDRAKKRSA